MSQPYFQVSRDAARALEEFSDQFRSALVLTEPDQWDDLGLSYTLASAAGTATFPLPIDAAGYKEFEGDLKYRRLYTRSMSFRTKQWADGVEEQANVIENDQFNGFADAPGNMAREWKRLPLLMLASMLQGPTPATVDPAEYVGPLLDLYRDRDSNTASTINLFADAHPCNVFDTAVGTFDNLRTTSLADIASGAFFDDLYAYSQSVLGPNGKPLDVTVDGTKLLLPTTLTRPFKKVLEQDTLITAISNAGVQGATANVVTSQPRKNIDFGQISGKTVREFSVANGWGNVFFAVLGGNPSLYPWVALQDSAPEERLFDKSSEFYKNSGKVKIGYIGNANVGAAMPHRIVRYQVI
jgi:hypothetical protein